MRRWLPLALVALALVLLFAGLAYVKLRPDGASGKAALSGSTLCRTLDRGAGCLRPRPTPPQP